MTDGKNKLLQAKTHLALKEPFFSTMLYRFPMIETDLVQFAAVTPRGQILYNAKAIEKLSVDEIIFLLCHEVLHIAFSHTLRRGDRDHLIFNIACDAVINETLIELGVGRFIESGVRMKGAQNRYAEDIYDEIYANVTFINLPFDLIFSGDKNGSGIKGDSLGEARKVYGDEISDSLGKDLDNEVKMAVAEAITKQKVMGKGKDKGRAMGKLITLLEDYVLTEKLPWHALLGQYMNKFVSQNQSWRRPNKRFSEVYLPSVDKEARMGTLVVGIDTSGSISDETLACFGRHLFDVIEECKPEEVFVLWCDTHVTKVETHQWEDVPFELKAVGRGGTDMRSINKWVIENVPDADACVIFTDGLTPYPEKNEEGIPTLWVITNKRPSIPNHIQSVFFEMDDVI